MNIFGRIKLWWWRKNLKPGDEFYALGDDHKSHRFIVKSRSKIVTAVNFDGDYSEGEGVTYESRIFPDPAMVMVIITEQLPA